MRQLELYRYNPGQCEPEDLKATFVAREAMLADILSVLRERADAPTNQHFLIVGPRGIGKTNLLLMIKYNVLEDPVFLNKYIPLQTAEEEYSIVSLRDFFSKILELLFDHNPDNDLIATLKSTDALEGEEQAVDILIHTIENHANKSGKKILLLLDNFDLILDEKIMDKAQSGKLRDVLMNRSFLTLVAAAPTHFKEVSGYDRPFYQFFQAIELEELSFEKIRELLKKQAEIENNQQMLQKFDELKPRIEAIHHITGGNPRLVLMLYQLYSRSEIPEVRAAVIKLLDDLTPYYKHRMEDLPVQQRKVLDTFARIGHPVTPTELARATRLKVNQINSILTRLGALGFVSKSPQKRRKTTYYMVSERVFRIWHQMRFSKATRRKVEFFIEFLRIWYSEKEWLNESESLLKSYAQNSGEKRYLEAGRFIEHLEYMFEAAPKPEMGYQIIDATIKACIDSRDYEQAKRLINEQIRRYKEEGNAERLSESYFSLSILMFSQGKLSDEIKALEKAIEFKPDSYHALKSLGIRFYKSAKEKEGKEKEKEILLRDAIDKFEKAAKIKPDDSAINIYWGMALGMLSHEKEGEEREYLIMSSIQKFQNAVEVEPDNPGIFLVWGSSLILMSAMKDAAIKKDLLRQAINKYDKAIELDSDYYEIQIHSMHGKGLALYTLALMAKGIEKRAYLENAFNSIQKAIEKTGKSNVKDHYFYSEYLRIALLFCKTEINIQNYGHAKDIFMSALEKSSMAKEDVMKREYIRFFINILSENTVSICDEYIELLDKQKLTAITQVLEPFKSAITYWKTDEKDRDEFLDRINPEMREVVEELIQKS
jgi:tetratricopeptide (TPR) repeat protein